MITAHAVEPWVSQAAETYNATEQYIDGRQVVIEIIPMQGLSALNKWSRGEFDSVPTVWLAESRIWVEQANAQTDQDIFLNGGRYRAQPVALSPLVWGIWQEPFEVLTDYFDTDALSWDELHEAATEDNWEALGGEAEWGKFKLVVAHPIRDPAGLTAIVRLTAWTKSSRRTTRQKAA